MTITPSTTPKAMQLALDPHTHTQVEQAQCVGYDVTDLTSMIVSADHQRRTTAGLVRGGRS